MVYLVHSLGTSDFEHVDRLAADNVATAAESASARRIVYLGGLGGGEEADSRHLRSRDETATRLTFGAVPVTTLRAAMVVRPGSAAFETIRALVDRLPAMVCPRWVSTPTQPDRAPRRRPLPRRRVWPRVAAGRVVRRWGPGGHDVSRDDRAHRPDPGETAADRRGPCLDSAALVLVAPPRDPGQRGNVRPLIDGLRTPTIVRENRIRELVPFELTLFDDAVREALLTSPPRGGS